MWQKHVNNTCIFWNFPSFQAWNDFHLHWMLCVLSFDMSSFVFRICLCAEYWTKNGYQCSVTDCCPLVLCSLEFLIAPLNRLQTTKACVMDFAAEEPGCKSNDDCPQSDTCLNRQCVNPCTVSNPCAPNAECQATNHRAVCHCPSGLAGNPFINCYQGM